MEEHEIDAYAQTLHPQLRHVHEIAKSLVLSTHETLSDNFKIAREIEDIFTRHAKWKADAK